MSPNTCDAFDHAEFFIAHKVSRSSLTARSCVCCLIELRKISECLSIYFLSVALLHVAHRISNSGLTDELMNLLYGLLGQFINTGRHCSRRSSVLLLSKAVIMMKAVDDRFKSRNTVQPIDDHNSSDIVELLQLFAVECLKTYRQLEARDFGPEAKIVTTDFEAMYAYKRGDYQRCLQLSTQNVYTLLYADEMPNVHILLPVFIQLLDNEIVALTAPTLIVCPRSSITQLTLSLYLMIQCQLKLRHPVMSLAQTANYMEVAQKRHPVEYIKYTLDQLVLKFIAQKAYYYCRKKRFRWRNVERLYTDYLYWLFYTYNEVESA